MIFALLTDGPVRNVLATVTSKLPVDEENPGWVDVTKVGQPIGVGWSFDGTTWTAPPPPPPDPLTETQVLAALLVVQGTVSLSDAAAVVDATPQELTDEANAWSVAVRTKG